MKTLLLAAGILFFLPPHAHTESSSSPFLEEVSDRNYLPRILELIQGARTSIEASLYQVLLAESGENHPVYQILKALAEARARGVRIRVLLNRYLDYVSGESIPLARSLAAYEYLTQKGIEVVFAHPSRRLHDKVMVIDERWVIEGSMNWTKTALESNWESATLMDSQEYAAKKLARLHSIPVSEEKTLDTLGDEGEILELPAFLVREEKYFPDLLERKDGMIFKFYLGLVEESVRFRKERWVLGDETLFKRFGLDPARSRKDKRREAVRLLKKLKKRGWIDLKIPEAGADVEITLRRLREPFSLAEKVIPGSSRVGIPLRYFDYGYPKRLSLAAEFVYFLARLEMTESPSPPWWWRSQEYLTRVYHLHHTTLSAGMLELARENLIEIVRDDAPEGRPHSERLVNRYRVNRLVSPAAREEQWRRLIQRFGRENFDQAREWADQIDEPNDPVVVATILKWMSVYSREDLAAAFQQVSRYERNNPRRSLYYLRGILEAMKR